MNKVKYYVTDVDGVIFDRLTLNTKIFVEFIGRFVNGAVEDAKSYYHSTQGTPLQEQLMGCLKKMSVFLSQENADVLYREYMRRAEFETFKLMPNAEMVLKSIYTEGIQIYATSGSSTPFLEREFTARGLNGYFTGVLGSNSIPKSREHISKFAELAKVSLEQFVENGVYVGDGSSDMQIAAQVGLVGIGVVHPLSREELYRHGATYTVNNVIEILDILGIPKK